MKQTVKKWISDRGGTTLVELIVSFALISIFLTSASMVLGAYFRIYTHAREYGHQQTVAAMLLDTMEYELGSAGAGKYQKGDTTEGAGQEMSGVTIRSDYTEIYYQNQDQTSIVMRIDPNTNKLQILYQVLRTAGEKTTYQEYDWFYGQGVYNNNTIKELTFAPFFAEGGTTETIPKNLVKITLTLQNETDPSITYTASRVVRCYNLTGEVPAGNENFENAVHIKM
ncbi:MAG: hypothetical protein PHE06_12135 [Lachnospiraceae bacterium]|nr:hypothetical protein [Lachnospiraceae bacterium]MDD3796687.1 hypothetical protein [Lachnospiraceae bacterium]